MSTPSCRFLPGIFCLQRPCYIPDGNATVFRRNHRTDKQKEQRHRRIRQHQLYKCNRGHLYLPI